MDENRNKLLELMESLTFPLTKEESIEKVKNLTDEEVADLLSIYSDVDAYQNQLEDFVRENNPKEYDKLVLERTEKLKKKDREDEYELERAQEDADIRLDSSDIKTEREIKHIVDTEEEDANAIEELQKEIDNALINDRNLEPTVTAAQVGTK